MQKEHFIKEYIHFPFEAVFNSCQFDTDYENTLLSHRAKFGINSKDHNNILIFEERDLLSFTLKRNVFSDKKLCIIICAKDNPSILNFCLANLQKNNTKNLADILVVDDRSCDDSLYNLAREYETSYIRADNNSNIFSFSNLNNIAAAYCYKYGKEDVIFWNSDMWTDHPETLLSIVTKHRHYKSDLTGVRLTYPKKEVYNKEFGQYEHVLNENLEHAFNTIQHGGITYVNVPQFVGSKHLVLRPIHLWRFYPKDYPMACKDSPSYGVTGAFQLMNTELFINLGGYATSMPSCLQDIDLNLRVLKNKLNITYIGSEFLCHAETITSNAEKNIVNEKMLSDSLAFDFVWNDDIRTLVGLQAPQFVKQ